MSELYAAIDQDYITKEEFNDLYSSAKTVRSKVGGFIKYLKEMES